MEVRHVGWLYLANDLIFFWRMQDTKNACFHHLVSGFLIIFSDSETVPTNRV